MGFEKSVVYSLRDIEIKAIIIKIEMIVFFEMLFVITDILVSMKRLKFLHL